MSKLFGTDGIRGVPGEPPLDPATLRRLGAAFARQRGGGRFLLGRDTRASGEDLSRAVAEGLAGAGATAVRAGVLPTPAVSRLVAAEGMSGGVVLSASHNPWQDNGVKLLAAGGEKLTLREEQELEAALQDPASSCQDGGPADPARAEGRVCHEEGRWAGRYVDLLTAPGRPLEGRRLVVDAAHGAMYQVAPEVLIRCGAEVVATLGDAPDGRNINEGVGSLHTEGLARKVRETGADLGIAFDGDGDRCLLVDAEGKLRDGDDILYLCARDRRDQERLPGAAVVGTVMTNVGLESALQAAGIRLHRSSVGDRCVLELMRDKGLALGGEPSGHLIFLDREVTGDGLLTALEVLDALGRRDQGLAEACAGWTRCPQVLVNVPVAERRPLEDLQGVRSAEERARRTLEGKGRTLLRYSGTELLLRVMVEGPEEPTVRALAEEIAEAARAELGR